MHVISYKAINDFIRQHPTAKSSLDSWFEKINKTQFFNFNELRATFPSVDVVKNIGDDNLYVFNINNKIRLIAAIHYNRNKLFIRHILTHAEYDKEKWKT